MKTLLTHHSLIGLNKKADRLDENLPLSFSQRRLWVMGQLVPNSPLYNIPVACKITSDLEFTALKQSFDELVRRHETLRTTLAMVDEEPVQRIASATAFRLNVIDLRSMPEDVRKAECQQLVSAEAQQPFDLTEGPLFRVQLLHLDQSEYLLLLTMHHIIADRWSLDVLMHELTVLYGGFVSGKPAKLPELSIQYADFTLWQHQWLQEKGLDEQLAYWRQQLKGELPVLELPTDRIRPPIQTYQGARKSFELSESLTGDIKALSQQEGATLFMTLLAAFKTLLYRYTGQDDVVVGSPTANRNSRGTEALVGFLANKLVLRSDLSGDPNFRQVLGRVREVALGAYAHQDLPFEKLVEELQPERDMSYSPMFQVMLELESTTNVREASTALNLNTLDVDNGTSQFDLTLSLKETDRGLVGAFIYSTELFDEATIVRMAGHWQTLLKEIVRNPDQEIRHLPMLPEQELKQLLNEWNGTDVSYTKDKCVHQLFEAQVERTPDNIAVVFEDRQLTYRALNQKANQLAHHLQKLGVGPDIPVGICVERSLEMIVGLLAILKAGGAYVPLAPEYPQERLSLILEDTHLSVLVIQEHLTDRLPAHGAKVITLDPSLSNFSEENADNPVSAVTPEHLIAILYTSGSTGRPKGTMINGKGFLNLCLWYERDYSFTEQDKFLLLFSFSFDAAFRTLITPLMIGGQLVITPSFDAIDNTQAIAKHGVSVINTTPSIFYTLLEGSAFSQYQELSSLKYVSLGGEPMDIEKLKTWFKGKHCSCELFNLYGPTEGSDVSTKYQLNREAIDTFDKIPLGKPIYNAKTYIVDQHFNLQPIGVPGELCISGDIVARGYLNNPTVTADKFIPNPWIPGTKMYRTGDLVRYFPDGNIEFLGRIDHQVKVRGLRIELGEIEALLGQHEAVETAVVVNCKDALENQYLVAYLVAKKTHDISADEACKYIKEKVPGYMVPSSFRILESVPLNPNGKIDRASLAKNERFVEDQRDEFVAPESYWEHVISDIWLDILPVDKVGIYDNFFDIGGHSLRATQFISRIYNMFEVKLPLLQLFESPTISDLAKCIEMIALLKEDSNVSSNSSEEGYVEGRI